METNLTAGNAMTTDNNTLTPETTAKASWGAQFEAARKALHLNEKDAAARLHLKPHIITIIEAENFKDGPPAIFMRGYIRSYGRMLNFSEKEIVQALAQMDLANPATSAFTPSPQRIETRNHSNNNHVGWSTAFVVLGLSALVGMWWWNSHSHNTGNEVAAPLADATPSAAQTVVTATATPDNNPALNSTQGNIAASTNSITDSTNAPVTTPGTAPTATAQNTPGAAPTTAAPSATTPTAPGTTAAATTPATTATGGAPTATAPTTASTEKPVISEPTTLPSLEEDEADANATQATAATKPHYTKTPDMANAEMSVPEEGLDDSPQ
jgi:cytoskeleton protein RodZ